MQIANIIELRGAQPTFISMWWKKRLFGDFKRKMLHLTSSFIGLHVPPNKIKETGICSVSRGSKLNITQLFLKNLWLLLFGQCLIRSNLVNILELRWVRIIKKTYRLVHHFWIEWLVRCGDLKLVKLEAPE